MFRDITPLLQDGESFRSAIGHLASLCADVAVDGVVGIEARGFIFGAALAQKMNLGFVPMRKQGKLPFSTIAQPSKHEYGEAILELHSDALKPGQRVVLVDDLVATGGTVLAAQQLIARLGAQVSVVAALIDLPDLGGSSRLRAAGLDVRTLMEFAGH
jgi:adenine phosphoribosyltransferase